MIRRNINLINDHKYRLDTDIYSLDRQKYNSPLLIFCHGFKGFKDWGGFPYMMGRLAEAGFVAVSFNFSFNGVGKNNPTEFTHLELFSQNTYSKELTDLQCVIDYFYQNPGKFNINNERIALIGHSRGGGISIIKSAEEKRIKCLITLSAVSNFDRYSTEHKKKWHEEGYFEVLNTRTNQMMRINSSLLDDIEENKNRLNILKAIKKLDIPVLIIHGKEDLSVRFSEADVLYKSSNKKLSELFPIANTGHTFGVVHPFNGTTKAFEIVIDKILNFLDKYLSAG